MHLNLSTIRRELVGIFILLSFTRARFRRRGEKEGGEGGGAQYTAPPRRQGQGGGKKVGFIYRNSLLKDKSTYRDSCFIYRKKLCLLFPAVIDRL